jgi:periplasmic protein TonB
MGYQALLFCPDEKTARTVTQVLNDLDFVVEPCTEPFAAVKKLMAQHFDAVVVDCDNEQNATLLFKSARNSSSNQSSLAVAVVEGQAGVAKAFRIGANLVLTKPINVEQAKGTLRVARGLLRKGGELPKTATPAPPVSAPASKPAATRPSGPVAPAFAAASTLSKPANPAISIPTPAVPMMPAMAASAQVADIDDQESDSILDGDVFEEATHEPAFEPKPTTSGAGTNVSGTPKFPWQPSPKMAEPMASALRRAAEAAGQVEPLEAEPAKPAASSLPEKRPMTGAMFQAQVQANAAAPAWAPEKPVPAPEPPLAINKTIVHEVAEPKPAERNPSKTAIDTTENDVQPPTFFPGAYDSEEVEGGGKTKAIIIIAAVVLLAASAGYLSLKNMKGKDATAQSSQATTAPEMPATSSAATPSDEKSEIPLGSTTSSSSVLAHETPAKPSPSKEVAPPSEPEPEVTQRLIVKNNPRPATPKPSQDTEAVQAPDAIGMGATADTKALASISNAPVNVPKASAQTLRVSQGVMEGLVLKRVQPRYPTQALQMRIQGSVQLQATITKNGDIENLKVVSGDAVLSRAAMEAVRQWKYKPYYLNGDPVPIETQIQVNFKLPN